MFHILLFVKIALKHNEAICTSPIHIPVQHFVSVTCYSSDLQCNDSTCTYNVCIG